MSDIEHDASEVARLYDRLGTFVRDAGTGICGRVTAVCFNEWEATQFRLTRYGVDANGAPYAPFWAYVVHCVQITFDEARSG